MKTTSIEIPVVEFGDDVPDGIVPDAATAYERQEIRRAWADAHRSLNRLAASAADLAAQLDEPAGVHRGNGPDRQAFVEATASIAEFVARLDGVHHRIAIERQNAVAVDSCVAEISDFLDSFDQLGANVDHEEIYRAGIMRHGEPHTATLRASTLRRLLDLAGGES